MTDQQILEQSEKKVWGKNILSKTLKGDQKLKWKLSQQKEENTE
jgi:hypothetical protein